MEDGAIGSFGEFWLWGISKCALSLGIGSIFNAGLLVAK